MYGSAEYDGRWAYDAAWQQRSRLAPADQALLAAYVGPHYPQPATLSELIVAGEQAAAEAPLRAEAWHAYGDNLLRFGPKIGYPDWENKAQEALARAHRLDSTRAYTVADLQLLAVRSGDTNAVLRYTNLHSALALGGAQAEAADATRWLGAVALGDATGLARLRSRFGEMSRRTLRIILGLGEALGLGLDDADRAARVYVASAVSAADHRTVMMGVVPYLLNRGRPGEASRMLSTAERGFGLRADVGVLEFRIFAALYCDGDSSDAAAAVLPLERYMRGARLSAGQARDPQTAACAVGYWQLASGNVRGATTTLATMRKLGVKRSTIQSIPICDAALDAQLAMAEKRPEAAVRLAELDSLLRAGADVPFLIPMVATLTAARLHERRGELNQALSCVRRHGFYWNQFLSTQLREEGRLATLAGDRASAARAYRQYVALRVDAEPALRPEVERARAELDRLTRVPNGH